MHAHTKIRSLLSGKEVNDNDDDDAGEQKISTVLKSSMRTSAAVGACFSLKINTKP